MERPSTNACATVICKEPASDPFAARAIGRLNWPEGGADQLGSQGALTFSTEPPTLYSSHNSASAIEFALSDGFRITRSYT